ncbi:MAG: ubiquinol-cytochrome C chaperone family protein [Alphaproteobacteria bacterium]
MILGPLFRRSPYKDAAHTLYVEAVRQARQPSFYASCGVPDTLDGRFDLIVLHVFLVMRALAQAGKAGQKIGSAVLDVMFDDMDMNLREMGVGDLSVGKKVKAMARAYHGRARAYGEALAPDAAPGVLAAALDRNLFGRDEPTREQLDSLVGYVQIAAAAMARQPAEAVVEGRIAFPPAPALAGVAD